MPSPEDLRRLYAQLAEALPPEAVERSSGVTTKRGYDTTGYRAAYLIDRLNRILGLGCLRIQPKFSVHELTSAAGRGAFEGVCELVVQIGQWEGNQFHVVAEAPGIGSHVSLRRGDALKGGYTNALKRALSHLGPGWQAFAGAIDDDNQPPEGLRAGPVERPARTPRPRANPQPQPQAQEQRRAGGNAANANNAAGNTNGRITSAQLNKLRELVSELGGNWTAYRDDVRQKRGVNIEYADRRTASELIAGLLSATRKGNGSAAGTQ